MTDVDGERPASTREEARTRGLDRFFTGVPCKHGHIAARYVSTTQCVACQLDHARKSGGWQARPSKEEYFKEAVKLCEQRGGTLLSTEYASAKGKLIARCGNGHEFRISGDNLKQDRWCPKCKLENQTSRMAAQRASVDELRQFVRNRHGGDCLAILPSSVLSKVMWKCSKAEHRSFEAVIAKVIHSGQWCPACWQERRTPPKPAIAIDSFTSIVRDRGGEIVHISADGVWRGSKTRVLLSAPMAMNGEPMRRTWCTLAAGALTV